MIADYIMFFFHLYNIFYLLLTDHGLFFRCFLSNEAKPVATIIKSMLKQALELRSCFKSLDELLGSTVDQLNLHSLINFSQVFSQCHMHKVVWFS